MSCYNWTNLHGGYVCTSAGAHESLGMAGSEEVSTHREFAGSTENNPLLQEDRRESA